jgi:NAD(P)H-dependent FMN reductase
MRILALSGSLRAASINSMLLRATARLAPRDINVAVFNGLGDLPLFNPDLEGNRPASVLTLHQAVAESPIQADDAERPDNGSGEDSVGPSRD